MAYSVYPGGCRLPAGPGRAAHVFPPSNRRLSARAMRLLLYEITPKIAQIAQFLSKHVLFISSFRPPVVK